MAQKFRILSIDGGGLRGVVPVLVLQELERRMKGKRIHEMFDLIAGTSTGGMIATALTLTEDGKTVKYRLDEILSVYTERGNEIFPKKGRLENFINSILALKRPKFSDRGIDKVLRDLVGDKRILNCMKPIFITSYDLYNNEAVFFKTSHAVLKESKNAELYDVCRATSAGPTFLPAYICRYDNKQRALVDGGVFMNNPTVAVITEALKYGDDKIYNRPGKIPIEDICVLSLGTGHYTANMMEKKVENWGTLDWVKPITDVMMQGVNQTTSYQANELLENGQYLRLNLDIHDEKHSNITDSSPETCNYLIQQTKEQILNNSTLMNELDNFIKKAQL